MGFNLSPGVRDATILIYVQNNIYRHLSRRRRTSPCHQHSGTADSGREFTFNPACSGEACHCGQNRSDACGKDWCGKHYENSSASHSEDAESKGQLCHRHEYR